MTDKQIKEPFYCEECNKCSSTEEIYSNLKVKNNTGWTHDIYCLKREEIVYRM